MVRNVSESEFMQALKEFGYESRDRLIFQALLGRSLRWLTLNYTGVRWLQRDYAFFVKFWDSNNWTPKMPRDLSIWRQFMPPTHFRQKKRLDKQGKKKINLEVTRAFSHLHPWVLKWKWQPGRTSSSWITGNHWNSCWPQPITRQQMPSRGRCLAKHKCGCEECAG